MMSLLIPSIRASVADELYGKYNYKQDEIAKSLGIVQVAVSKYVNNKCSERMKKVKDFINTNKLNRDIIAAIMDNKGNAEINMRIEELCTNKKLLEFAS